MTESKDPNPSAPAEDVEPDKTTKASRSPKPQVRWFGGTLCGGRSMNILGMDLESHCFDSDLDEEDDIPY